MVSDSIKFLALVFLESSSEIIALSSFEPHRVLGNGTMSECVKEGPDGGGVGGFSGSRCAVYYGGSWLCHCNRNDMPRNKKMTCQSPFLGRVLGSRRAIFGIFSGCPSHTEGMAQRRLCQSRRRNPGPFPIGGADFSRGGKP